MKYLDRKLDADCDLEILTTFPKDETIYEVMGTCKGRGAMMITDGSAKAMDRVIKCANKHGANAIVLTEMRSTGYSKRWTHHESSEQQTGQYCEAKILRIKR